jgi:hypothetical protein
MAVGRSKGAVREWTRRRFYKLPEQASFHEFALIPPEWDDGVHDDILEGIRARGSLDRLVGPPDLGGYEPAERIGPPYQAQREAEEKHRREREREEAYLAERERRAEVQRQREEWSRRQREEAERRQREEVERRAAAEREEIGRRKALRREGAGAAWSRVRKEPLLIKDTLTCAQCGRADQPIVLPPPRQHMHGMFHYYCHGCGMEIGLHSKRLTAECDELERVIAVFGVPADPRLDNMSHVR